MADNLAKEFVRDLGTRIREVRKARGMSQDDLAVDAGMTRRQISRIETAEVNTSIGNVWAIAHALDLSLSELVSFNT